MGVCQMHPKPRADILRLTVDTRSWAVSFGLKTVYALNTNNDLMALEWNTVAEVQPAEVVQSSLRAARSPDSNLGSFFGKHPFTGSLCSVYTLERTLDFRDWQELSTLQTDSSGAGAAE